MGTSVITVRLDEELKKQFEEVVDELGLNMTTAITAFVKTVVRQEGIPFEPPYSPESKTGLFLQTDQKGFPLVAPLF